MSQAPVSLSPLEHSVLFLSRSEIVRAGGDRPDLYIPAVTEALRLHADNAFAQPLKPYLRWRRDGHVADRLIAMPAYVGGATPAAGLKWVGSKHDNPQRLGLERASALIVLNDPQTHFPTAVLEGALISGMRTAAVTAVAARHLAREGFASVACLGCGPIARLQLRTLLEQFPSLDQVHLFDLRRDAADRLAADLADSDGGGVVVHSSAEAAVRRGDVVITSTTADRPYLGHDWIRAGALVANVSLMDVEKTAFLRADKLVVDDWDQCNREGKIIHQLVQEGRLTRTDLHAQLGEIVAGRRPGRERDEEIILFNPMGMAIADIACAQAVYHAALHEGVGRRMSLG